MVKLVLHNATHIANTATSNGTICAFDNGPDFGASPNGCSLFASCAVGSSTRARVVIQQSDDGATWFTGKFYKWSGAAAGTIATSCALSGGFCGLFGELVQFAPYVRAKVRSSGTKSTVMTLRGWLF